MATEAQYIQAIAEYGNHFSPKEFSIRQDTEMTDLQFHFFEEVLRFRQWANLTMLPTSAYRPGDRGAHGFGLALDVILFNDWKTIVTNPLEQWLKATTWPWLGVGIYFDWQFVDKDGNRKPAVGLHLDLHRQGDRPLRWLRFTEEIDGEPKQLYFYQNTTNGRFFNSKTQRTVELVNVISRLWQ